ncbi:MAG TPA: hypothetical protein VFP84_34960, partial [Kofleriaceae bacterium]|nr:hypothetical protein [Kofleriaceae bacterium]
MIAVAARATRGEREGRRFEPLDERLDREVDRQRARVRHAGAAVQPADRARARADHAKIMWMARGAPSGEPRRPREVARTWRASTLPARARPARDRGAAGAHD